MEMYYSKDLGDKNFKTVNEVLKQQRDTILDLEKQVEQLKQMVATQNNEIGSMNQRLMVVFSKSMGTGATQ